MNTYDRHYFFRLGHYAGKYGSGSQCPYKAHWRLRRSHRATSTRSCSGS
jgi:hypothetical protein